MFFINYILLCSNSALLFSDVEEHKTIFNKFHFLMIKNISAMNLRMIVRRSPKIFTVLF